LTGADTLGATLTDVVFADDTVCPDGRLQSDFPRCGF